MDKGDFLKRIADKAYDVGFGAKKSFASFEIIAKGPGWISYFSIAVGVLALVFSFFSIKMVSVLVIMLGIAGLNIQKHEKEAENFEMVGKRLTILFNQLRDLTAKVEDNDSGDFSKEMEEFQEIENEYYKISISEQIFLSDWMAHYKFFRQMQYGWIEKYRNFRLIKDKIPTSFILFLIALVVFVVFLTMNGGADSI